MGGTRRLDRLVVLCTQPTRQYCSLLLRSEGICFFCNFWHIETSWWNSLLLCVEFMRYSRNPKINNISLNLVIVYRRYLYLLFFTDPEIFHHLGGEIRIRDRLWFLRHYRFESTSVLLRWFYGSFSNIAKNLWKLCS